MNRPATGRRRRGVTAVQAALVLAGITLAVVVGGGYLSSGANQQLETTADGIAEPAQLADFYRD